MSPCIACEHIFGSQTAFNNNNWEKPAYGKFTSTSSFRWYMYRYLNVQEILFTSFKQHVTV